MADKDKLSAERAKLEEKKRKISHVTEKETSGHTDTSDEVTRDSELFSSKTSFDYLFKIVIVGDAACGKTSLMKRFVDDIFHCDTLTTIGVDFNVKTLTIEETTVKLQIWDTAGQERYAPLGQLYYHGAHAVVIAYDVTSKKTFGNVDKWKEKVEERNEDNLEDLVTVLVGCKADLGDIREVTQEAGKTAAIKMGSRWIETSSKTGSGVLSLFEEVTRNILNRKKSRDLSAVSRQSVTMSSLGPGVEILAKGGDPGDQCLGVQGAGAGARIRSAVARLSHRSRSRSTPVKLRNSAARKKKIFCNIL